MSAFAAFALGFVTLGAVAVLVLRRYAPHTGPDTAAPSDETTDATEQSEHVVFPPNDTTGGHYLNDPARAGWEEPPPSGGDESASDARSSDVSAAPGRLVTVPPETLAPARESLEAGDAERAVDRAYHAVREELTARAGLDGHRTPQEFRDGCRAAFDGQDLDAVESLVGLYDQVADGSTVSRGMVEVVLDRLVGHDERLDRYEWWELRQDRER
jgi:hypothetical protein